MLRLSQVTTCLAALVLIALGSAAAPTAQGTLSLCGNPGPASGPIRHVLVVMMENLSYRQVVGNANAPFQTSLARQCGVATAEFAATHTSGANYLAVSAGEYPPSSPPGCGGIQQCADASNNLYNQLGSAGLSWAGFEEAMPSPCDPSSSGPVANGHAAYSVGHNPIVFYTDIPHAACVANDVPVADLTAESGAFWNAAQNQTLPAFSFLTPSAADDNEGGKTKALGEQIGDAWLQRFVATLQQSASYQSGNTLVLIAYDEGEGGDFAVGENCTNMSLDLPVTNGVSAHQDSCHVPLFVVYPYTAAGDADATFFDHYSITRTVEDLFGLPYLAHAGDSQTASLVGHFGIPSAVAVQPPSVTIARPAGGSTVSGQLTVSGTASDDSGIAQVTVRVDGGTPVAATGTGSWSTVIDTSSLANGQHTISAQARANDGGVATTSVTVTVANTVTPTSCPAPPAGGSELSQNPSLESGQQGWTGKYSANSVVARVAPPGGSFDGNWALRASGAAAGAAGVANASPFWVPGPPGIATTAGQTYTGGAVVQASAAGEKLSLRVRELSPGGAVVGSRVVTVTLADTGWHQLNAAYTAAQSGDSLRYALFSPSLGAGKSFLADCLTLQMP